MSVLWDSVRSSRKSAMRRFTSESARQIKSEQVRTTRSAAIYESGAYGARIWSNPKANTLSFTLTFEALPPRHEGNGEGGIRTLGKIICGQIPPRHNGCDHGKCAPQVGQILVSLVISFPQWQMNVPFAMRLPTMKSGMPTIAPTTVHRSGMPTIAPPTTVQQSSMPIT